MIKNPSFSFEKELWAKGLAQVVGIDEVGRGSFAGPVVAAAVILPQSFKSNGVNDSKLLNPEKRKQLSAYIKMHAVCFCIEEVEVSYINAAGIVKATQKAFGKCIDSLQKKFDFVLVDGFKVENLDNSLQKAIIHGDRLSISIAAASIIAKVYRDTLMVKLHEQFPQYGFFYNKGYGTKFHQDAIRKHGLSRVHRTSFNLQKFL